MIVVVARTILVTRSLRRRLLLQLCGVMIALLALGVATVGQIPAHPWLMLFYWLGVTALTMGVFLLALWDLLAVRREESVRQNPSARRPTGGSNPSP